MSQQSDKDSPPSSEGSRDEMRMSGASIGKTILLDDYHSQNTAPLFIPRPRPMERTPISRDGVETGQKAPPLNVKEKVVEGGVNKSSTSIRKRSRIGDNPSFDRLKLQEEGGYKKKIDDYLFQLAGLTETIVKKGDKSKLTSDKVLLNEVIKDISNEIIKILSTTNVLAERVLQLYDGKQQYEQKILKLSEENNLLRQQIIELQAQAMQHSTTNIMQQTASSPYLQAVMKNVSENIKKGTALPIPSIPDTIKHSPAEKILMFKAKVKTEQVSKREQEAFRKDLNNAIGETLMKQLTVIRPTRYGGHTVIFQDEKSRDKALTVLRGNEQKMGIDEKLSCIIAPKKKMAKAICRIPPEDVNPDNFLKDLYGSYNPYLHKIPSQRREARIIISVPLGWIFELTSEEAQAFYLQKGRVRYGYGRELKVEEFIPLQQCYRCSAFGHNASECTSEQEYCRLCAKVGHAGKDCQFKDDKKQWRCINCKFTNEAKGYKLSTEHAAAQLHKCPCAHNQKMIKREQLAAAGVFTTPITDTMIQEFERAGNRDMQQETNGLQLTGNNKEKTTVRRKKSRSKSINKVQSNNNGTIPQMEISSSSASIQKTTMINTSQQNNRSIMANMPRISQGVQRQRMTHDEVPKVTEGWKVESKSIEGRGRDSTEQLVGTNSTSNMEMALMTDTEDQSG